MPASRPYDFDRFSHDSRFSGLQQDIARLERQTRELERQTSELERSLSRAHSDIDGHKNDFMLLVFALVNVAIIVAAIATRR